MQVDVTIDSKVEDFLNEVARALSPKHGGKLLQVSHSYIGCASYRELIEHVERQRSILGIFKYKSTEEHSVATVVVGGVLPGLPYGLCTVDDCDYLAAFEKHAKEYSLRHDSIQLAVRKS